MPSGGRRPGAGRPQGARNKRTREIEAAADAAREAIEEKIPEAFQGDAHALLMTVYKDPAQDWPLRIDAAKAAIKFEKPALSSVEAKVAMTVEELTDEQLDAMIHADAAASGLLAH
jgi:hypothetical protein